MRTYSVPICLSLALISNAFGAADEFNPVRHHALTASATDVQRVIVKLRETTMEEPDGVATLTQRTHLNLKQSRRITGGLHALRVQPAVPGEPLAATLARLRVDPAVEYAEADQKRYAQAAPNDPLYATAQWYLKNAVDTPSAIDAVTAWDTTTGTDSIVIADLDTGVRFDHPDLLAAGAGGRLLPGYDFISNAAAANDGNGRDADAYDPGDWIDSTDTGTTQFRNCDLSSSSWHGTLVAGILGALTNNNTGIAGVTWNSRILPVRVLGKCGGYDSDILDAMLWAAGLPVPGVPTNTAYPAKIVNMSLGSEDSCPRSYQEVISQLTALGVLVVVSAGNGYDNGNGYEGGPVDAPANCAGVVAVAGLRHAGTKVGYSNLGREIALSAPAGNCVNPEGQPCLYPIDTTTNTGTTIPAGHDYTDQINFSVGTSFSAPIVSGIAALMVAVNGNLETAQLIDRLQEGTTAFPSDPDLSNCHVPANTSDLQTECNCTTLTCGAGMANAVGAVAAALRPIAVITAPTSVAPGQDVSFQGGGSSAANGRIINVYSWSIVKGGATPPGISGADTATATLTAPASGSYTASLTVTDDAGQEDTTSVVVAVSSGSSGGGGAIDVLTLLAGVLATALRMSRRASTA